MDTSQQSDGLDRLNRMYGDRQHVECQCSECIANRGERASAQAADYRLRYFLKENFMEDLKKNEGGFYADTTINILHRLMSELRTHPVPLLVEQLETWMASVDQILEIGAFPTTDKASARFYRDSLASLYGSILAFSQLLKERK